MKITVIPSIVVVITIFLPHVLAVVGINCVTSDRQYIAHLCWFQSAEYTLVISFLK